MGTGFKHGAGGGAPLNFKVVGGTTAPSNPKENMIWVNTSTKITSYIFSATQPTGSAGMVWITTAASSTVEFNALKKNGIQVYPISAKQYIGGKWVDKTAKSYQNGAWVEWIKHLYKEGNECTDLTGGWITVELDKSQSYWTGGTNVVKNAGNIECKATTSKTWSYVVTAEKIDLTDVSKICINVLSAAISGNSTGHTRRIIISDGIKYSDVNSNNVAQKEFPKGTVGVVSLDVSGISGLHYVCFGATYETDVTGSLKVSEVWYE